VLCLSRLVKDDEIERIEKIVLTNSGRALDSQICPIDIQIWKNIFKAINVSESLFKAMFSAFDSSGSGLFSFRQLITSLSRFCRGTLPDKHLCKLCRHSFLTLLDFFNTFDRDENNCITVSSFRNGLGCILDLAILVEKVEICRKDDWLESLQSSFGSRTHITFNEFADIVDSDSHFFKVLDYLTHVF
jgi:Ca2+-binding EF-hand superfamily protein